jgi:hypothetical protein
MSKKRLRSRLNEARRISVETKYECMKMKMDTGDFGKANVTPRAAIQAQSRSLLATDLTIGARDTGRAACIMSGSQGIGRCGMVRKCGSVAITSREVTELRVGRLCNVR